MTGARKFTFDTVFAGKKDLVSDSARARQKKVLTQGEIDKLVTDARNEGNSAGDVRAREAVAAAVAHAAGAVREAIKGSRKEIEALRSEASTLAIAAAKMLAKAALANAPSADVETALRQAMHQAIGEPRLLLRASPQVVEALAGRIEAIAKEEGFEGNVQVAADSAQHGADCRMEWRGGGAERSQAVIEAALAELVARHFTQSSNPSSPEV